MKKVIDLFCGCGGLSLGFEQAGFDVVAAFDNWDEAIAVYRQNFKHPVIKLDLTDTLSAVSAIELFQPDMIIGGPPCQDFSSAGKRDENNGRGDLTISFAQIVSSVRPEWFLMENVSRIQRTHKLAEAKKLFKEAGYGLTETILNASLCGVPQKRKRFVLIGKLGTDDDFLMEHLMRKIATKEMTVADYFGDALDVKFYYRHPRSYVRRGVFSVNEPSPTIRGVNRPMPKGYSIHPNDPVNSLDNIRPLTTKERSLIQTFPADFDFFGSKTNVEQMIGNAVPVNFARFLAAAIKDYTETPLQKSIQLQVKPFHHLATAR
jgi:DNA (cytosine-5)-methyltransferase 1